MKKLWIVFCLLGCFGLSAQLKPVDFGFLVTANATYFNFKPGIGEIIPQGALGGSAFVRLRILILYAELEAGYSGHNAMTNQYQSGVKYETKYGLDGFDLSAVLGWRVIGIGRLGNFRIFAGYNYNNYSSITVETNGSSVKDPDLNKGNNSIVLGTGVDLWKIVFNLKYNMGLTDLSTLSTSELNTNIATVALGFKF